MKGSHRFGRTQIVQVDSTSRGTLATGGRLALFWSVPALLIVGGTIGYRTIERWPWFDSFYVAVITLTSIGYGDLHAYSVGGHILTIALALVGISSVAVAATELLRVVITGELRDSWARRRMRKRIDGLEQHVIVCGYGTLGRYVCAELLAGGVPVVAIDRAEALAASCLAGIHFVLGEATADAILRRAGIERARALVAAAGADSENVVIALTARILCPNLTIVARAEQEDAVSKLLRAGATRAASPYAIAGARIAQAALHPSAVDADPGMGR
ncbi:MAG TPA: potassium channel family protein [Acidobacteriaceae bacterium]|nr:potassium channel family protein [Acidobacteriaceae bacterium]